MSITWIIWLLKLFYELFRNNQRPTVNLCARLIFANLYTQYSHVMYKKETHRNSKLKILLRRISNILNWMKKNEDSRRKLIKKFSFRQFQNDRHYIWMKGLDKYSSTRRLSYRSLSLPALLIFFYPFYFLLNKIANRVTTVGSPALSGR